jgi:hypothetical protein
MPTKGKGMANSELFYLSHKMLTENEIVNIETKAPSKIQIGNSTYINNILFV